MSQALNNDTPIDAARNLLTLWQDQEPKGTAGATKDAAQQDLKRLNRNLIIVEHGGQTPEGLGIERIGELKQAVADKAEEIANWQDGPGIEWLDWAIDFATVIQNELGSTFSGSAMQEALKRSRGTLDDLIEGWQLLVLARRTLDTRARFQAVQVEQEWVRMKPCLPCQMPGSSDLFTLAGGLAVPPRVSWGLLADLDTIQTLTLAALRQMPVGEPPEFSSELELENSPLFQKV